MERERTERKIRKCLRKKRERKKRRKRDESRIKAQYFWLKGNEEEVEQSKARRDKRLD